MVERRQIGTQDYFALPFASNSSIREAHQLFVASEAGKSDPAAAYRFGSAFDALSTDPEMLAIDDLPESEVSLLTPMRRALYQDSIFNALFKNADKQAVFVDPEFQINLDGMDLTIPAKCKFDVFNTKFNFGGDLKSTVVKTKAQFESAASFHGYDRQSAWYMDITGTDRFLLIGISKRNNHIFHINITRDSDRYKRGKQQYLNYAASWWKLYGLTGMSSVAAT